MVAAALYRGRVWGEAEHLKYHPAVEEATFPEHCVLLISGGSWQREGGSYGGHLGCSANIYKQASRSF